MNLKHTTKNRILRAIRFMSSLALLVLICWGIIAAVRASIDYLSSLESNLGAAFLAASIAVIGSVVTLAIGKAYEAKAAIRSDLRAKKTPVYEDIMHTLLYDVMFASILGKAPPTEDELKEFFAHVTEKVTIWGSDDVLLAFGTFKTQSSKTKRPIDAIFLFEDLLLAIRKDLGHRNKGISRGAILRLFVTDLDSASNVDLASASKDGPT